MPAFTATSGIRSFALAVPAALLLLASPATAQLPNPSARALGMGGNYAAIADGYAAAAWNPAGLALRENPAFSLALFPIRADGGMEPLSFADLSPYSDVFVPAEVRAEWLERITANGGIRGAGGGDVTYVALNMGPFAAQVATRAYAGVSLAPDVAELLLFGNAGLTGEPHDFAFAGSTLDVSVTSTAAVAYAKRIPLELGPLPGERFAVGATLTYTVGHALLSGVDRGSALTSDPLGIALDFPLIYTDPNVDDLSNGRGFGLDLGAAWEGGPFAVTVAIRNFVNTFRWDESKLLYRPGRAVFDADTTVSEFEEVPFSQAPETARARLNELGFEPLLVVGLATRPSSRMTVTGELRRKFGDGLGAPLRTHAGIGLEIRPIRALPLRAGIAVVSGGVQLSGGVGLDLGMMELAASAAYRNGDLGTGGIGMLGVSFGGS